MNGGLSSSLGRSIFGRSGCGDLLIGSFALDCTWTADGIIREGGPLPTSDMRRCCLVLLSALLPSSHAQKGVAPAVQQHLKGLDPDKANVAKQAMARMGGMGGFRGGGMYGGIHDMFDDEDGFLFNAENKPLHAWTFEDWKDHQETMDSDEYKQMTEHQQREKFDKFHDKHEEKHQKALQAHSFSALFSTFATSRIGSWILLIIGLILFVCIGYCAMFCMKSKVRERGEKLLPNVLAANARLASFLFSTRECVRAGQEVFQQGRVGWSLALPPRSPTHCQDRLSLLAVRHAVCVQLMLRVWMSQRRDFLRSHHPLDSRLSWCPRPPKRRCDGRRGPACDGRCQTGAGRAGSAGTARRAPHCKRAEEREESLRGVH